MRAHHAPRGSGGFSAAEMLIALSISMVVMTAATKFFAYQVSAMRTERIRRAAQLTARTALSFIVRQLELLGRDPQRVLFRSLDTPTLAPAIAAAGASSIHYRTNLSAALTDVDVLDQWEDVTFSVDEGVLWVRQGTQDPLPLTDGTATACHVPDDGLDLLYFDGVGNPVVNLASDAARASVRRIWVSLRVIGGATGDDSGPSVTLSQDVFLRNVS